MITNKTNGTSPTGVSKPGGSSGKSGPPRPRLWPESVFVFSEPSAEDAASRKLSRDIDIADNCTPAIPTVLNCDERTLFLFIEFVYNGEKDIICVFVPTFLSVIRPALPGIATAFGVKSAEVERIFASGLATAGEAAILPRDRRVKSDEAISAHHALTQRHTHTNNIMFLYNFKL